MQGCRCWVACAECAGPLRLAGCHVVVEPLGRTIVSVPVLRSYGERENAIVRGARRLGPVGGAGGFRRAWG